MRWSGCGKLGCAAILAAETYPLKTDSDGRRRVCGRIIAKGFQPRRR